MQRMYETSKSGEQEIMLTPEIILMRRSKEITKLKPVEFANDLFDRLIEVDEINRSEDSLTDLWLASCNILNHVIYPQRTDKDFMDHEDRRQDVYSVVDKLLNGGAMYGGKLFSVGLKNKWRAFNSDNRDMLKHSIKSTSLDTMIDFGSEFETKCLDGNINISLCEYILKEYGDIAHTWYQYTMVNGFTDREFYSHHSIPSRTFKRFKKKLILLMQQDLKLVEMRDNM